MIETNLEIVLATCVAKNHGQEEIQINPILHRHISYSNKQDIFPQKGFGDNIN